MGNLWGSQAAHITAQIIAQIGRIKDNVWLLKKGRSWHKTQRFSISVLAPETEV